MQAGKDLKGAYVNRVTQLGIGLGLAAACYLGQAQSVSDTQRQSALSLEQQGKNAEAETAWRGILKAHPTSPEAYAHLGLLEARQEHYKEAIPLYRKALALGPKVSSVQLNLGLALFKGGELKDAIVEFSLLLKSEPGNQQLTTLMGLAHYGLAEYKEAVPYLRDAAAQDKQNLPLRLALAHSCLWSKQYQCVMDTYHEILDLNADSAEADMLAGETLDEMKDTDGSTKMFRAAVKANPNEPNVHFGLGYLLWAQKQYPEAVSEFQAELANDPNHIQAMLYLADSEIQLNQLEEGRPLLEKVEKLNPKVPLVHLDLGIVYTEAARKEDALRELTLAAKLSPDDVNVHWRLGRLYRIMGRVNEAKAEFDKASTLNKAADTDLFNKIANAHARPAESQQTVPPPAEK
jgi:tetratricopeptide (TPR) repeat protein